MTDLYNTLLCSIEQTITTLACKETAYGCIGKNSSDLHKQRLSLLSIWRLFDDNITFTSDELNIINCWYVENFGTLPVIKSTVTTTLAASVAPSPPDERILIDTRWAVNILHGANLDNLADPDFIAAGQDLAYMNYYVWIDPPSISPNTATEAAKINAYIALMPNSPVVDFYYDVRWTNGDMDALFTAFPNAENIILNQESQNEVFTPSYSSLVNTKMAYCAGRAEGIIDDALVYVHSTDANNRRTDVQNITGLTKGRQYDQVIGPPPDPILPADITTDYAANAVIILNYYDVTREQYLTDFFSQYPLQDQEAITQWDCIDTGSVPDNVTGTAFENWMLGMEVYFDLKHTDKYWYLAWLQLSNIPNNANRLASLTRLAPLFGFKYSEPYDLGIAGVRSVKVSNDDGTSAILINNSTAVQSIYSRTNISGLVGNFTLDIGYGIGSFGVAPTSLTLNNQTDIVVMPYSVTVAYCQIT